MRVHFYPSSLSLKLIPLLGHDRIHKSPGKHGAFENKLFWHYCGSQKAADSGALRQRSR